jgi:hypothetical protein
MQSQLIGAAAAPATGFTHQFPSNSPYLPKLFVPHRASVLEMCCATITRVDHVEARGKTRKSYLERGTQCVDGRSGNRSE